MPNTPPGGVPAEPVPAADPVLALVSTADTELLAARASGVPWRVANPARLDAAEVPAFLAGADVVVVRLLGGERAWPEGLAATVASGLPVVALGGESTPDAALMARGTVPAGVATEALAYLSEGGVGNLAELYRFLSDTLLLTGLGFAPPVELPAHGPHGDRVAKPDRPTVGVVFYRAHATSGNTAFVDALCDALEGAGANARPVFCSTLRGAAAGGVLDDLAGVDALVVTVLAAGGTRASDASAGGDEDAWDVGALATLDVPVVQGLCLTSSRAVWVDSDAGLSPMDAAMQVAIPEFDGRIITVPFSFKEQGADGVPVYVADPERTARVAGIASRLAGLRHTPTAEKKIAIVLSSYPTKHSRVGNAVGLDTPASAVLLLDALRAAGYDLGDGYPGEDLRSADGGPGDVRPDAAAGDALIHALIAAGGHDVEWLTEEQLAAAPARVPASTYEGWFARLPESLRGAMAEHWGPPPGSLYVDDGGLDDGGLDGTGAGRGPGGPAAEPAIVLAALRFGNVVLMIQPPRGFGENPVAIYHDPDLPPSHHYLAAYRWLDEVFGADAVIHLGKHGTLEWLPGKGLGLSAGCAPDAVLGDLPFVYPFLVNDPGEGTQAKRRAHAVIVDHLVPPMARADSYGDMAKLEQLLDEYATLAALDPAKLPAVRAQIWTLIQSAQLHHDLGQADRPSDAEFDDFLLHVDGYLCEVKDTQIRDGLHILGMAPAGEARTNLVTAILRANQMWAGRAGAVPGLRAALGHTEGDTEASRARVDAFEQTARSLVAALEDAGWSPAAVSSVVAGHLIPATDVASPPAEALVGVPAGARAEVERVLTFAATEVVPRLARTPDEIVNTVRALDGRFVPPGPSGSPTRGLVNVLPTGRNFASVDPKAIPSRLAWETGRALADSLIERYLADTGGYPASVGLTVWGTSAMRTQGDDIAEVLWLLGCRPTWDDASRRVTGFEVVPGAELGRPRVDVVVRISGFFRDAFPHVVALLDDAVRAVAVLDEPDDVNALAAHVRADLAALGAVPTVGGRGGTAGTADPAALRRATTRIFGSKPGAYGAGLLPLIDSRQWRSDADLAEVYAVWGGYAYGRGLDGAEARADMETAFRRIQIAVKNQDTREHDLVDSDDYFQYHGGMVAAVRALTGTSPAAYVGDSALPDAVRTRTLQEETHRVFRARVVNPRWIAAMRRHGYKGAFELAATVDYLFGYDATAGVVQDWMYESLAASYVFDAETREFLRTSNPWALRGMTERLLEAAERGLWEAPQEATLAGLQSTYLELEGDLEAAGDGESAG
ncbi:MULTISPECIES: cobaltochelatase subunit CobN [unclassified Parafrankia]|uniref:cobaltochelatase subunit CobN n=1 Tax=unclassified Parafrankia TaxID=2994368 RepID=UPI000DA5952A|nr:MULTISPECIES: cobaltochelatase subunit CobN [unclassified Parafrankia]SQD98946.1 Aerobic cobaltochelatase subunit CobN [Parafrankia sp. Ea1.12]